MSYGSKAEKDKTETPFFFLVFLLLFKKVFLFFFLFFFLGYGTNNMANVCGAAQCLIWMIPNISQKLGFSNKKIIFNITFWRNFHAVVAVVCKKKKIAPKFRENVRVDKKSFFLSKQNSLFFNITFWRNFHAVVWKFLYINEKKNRENIVRY